MVNLYEHLLLVWLEFVEKYLPFFQQTKNKELLEEEIYTTIISILKTQEKKIEEISSKVDKYFSDFQSHG